MLTRPNFTPEINWGHILQAGVLIVMVGTASLAAVFGFRSDIDAIHTILAQHDLRITAAEKAIDRQGSSNDQFRAEMRAKLEQILAALADVKQSVALKQDRK